MDISINHVCLTVGKLRGDKEGTGKHIFRGQYEKLHH